MAHCLDSGVRGRIAFIPWGTSGALKLGTPGPHNAVVPDVAEPTCEPTRDTTVIGSQHRQRGPFTQKLCLINQGFACLPQMTRISTKHQPTGFQLSLALRGLRPGIEGLLEF